jgi:DNA repair ATPase RecN
MNPDIEEIHRQLHDLRNYLGPVELLLANMEAQLKKSSMELERRISELELRLNELAKLMEVHTENLPAAPPCQTRLEADAAPPAASV